MIYEQFLAKVEEEEARITEKQQLLSVEEYGSDLSTIQTLLIKQKTFDAGE
jgi:hypothetical protein